MTEYQPEIKTAEEDKRYYIDQTSTTGVSSWFNFSNTTYLKGFAIAAGITAIATSPKVRDAIVKGGVKTWEYLQGGVEELKEKVHDVRAEMSESKKDETS